MEKARDLPADEVFLDLEDAVAPAAKADSRALVAAALRAGGWGAKIRAVRINDASTGWAYRDVVDVVEQAGDCVDSNVLPKVVRPRDVGQLDLLLGQIELATGLPPGRIAIEAQIEDAAACCRTTGGLAPAGGAGIRPGRLHGEPGRAVAAPSGRSPPVHPGDAFHYPHPRILVADEPAGCRRSDGPHAAIGELAVSAARPARPRSGTTASGSCILARSTR